MKRLVVPLVVALSALAHCQVGVLVSPIQAAMQALSTNASVFLQMTGQDVAGGVTTPFTYATYLQVSQVGSRVYDQVNVTYYDAAGKPQMCLVGDGVTLWRYDYRSNSYSAVNYGTYSGNQPADYTGAMFRDLTSLSQGYMSYPILLLRQIYGVDGASYQSWLPGVNPASDVAGNIVYSIGTPPRRTITFMLSTGALTDVVYDDVTTLRNLQKKTDWTIHIVGGPTMNPTLFKFVPPYGAKPVAGPRIPLSN